MPSKPPKPDTLSASPVTALRQRKEKVPAETPRHATDITHVREWLLSEGNLTHLKAIVNDPVFKVFCNYIEVTSDVSEDGLMLRPVPDAVIVRQAAFAAGLKAFHTKLKNFVIPASTKPQPEPYDYINPQSR